MSLGDQNCLAYYGQWGAVPFAPTSQHTVASRQALAAYINNFKYVQSQPKEQTPMIDGSKPLVICGGNYVTCEDMEHAQRRAEELAHQHSADAYILKPVKKVAPKRDVVTTDL